MSRSHVARHARRRRGFRAPIAALMPLVLAAALVASPAQQAAFAAPATATPVVFLHGGSLAACPGYDVGRTFYPATLMLKAAGWTGRLDLIGFYACDRNYTYSIGQFDTSLPTRFIARTLAWYLWFRYSMVGKPVDLVGHSMGGLIVRWLLYRVAQHDPQYPPYLLVERAVTISTPHAGMRTLAVWHDLCGATNYQCPDFATDSPFIQALTNNPITAETDWTTIGSQGCDIVPARSTAALPGAHVIVYTSPCYYHGAYLSDMSTAQDATTLTGTGQPHALAALRDALLAP
jgi:pimeloyl-ACP methyl ester carboxylesterase